MILNPSQAAAAYRSMCELNNVGGTAKLEMRSNGKHISVDATGREIYVDVKVGREISSENYRSQAEFARAYGLA